MYPRSDHKLLNTHPLRSTPAMRGAGKKVDSRKRLTNNAVRDLSGSTKCSASKRLQSTAVGWRKQVSAEISNLEHTLNNCNRVFISTNMRPPEARGQPLYVQVKKNIIKKCIDEYGAARIKWHIEFEAALADLFIDDIA